MNRWMSRLLALTLLLVMAMPSAVMAAPGGKGSGSAANTEKVNAERDGAKLEAKAGKNSTVEETACTTPVDPVTEPETEPVDGEEEAEAPVDCEEEPAPSEPQGKGQAVSAAAHAKIGARLQAMLDAGKITNENARANMEAVIAKMLGEAVAEVETATEEEALAEVEEALEAEGENATAAELDVLAEVQVRQGKKAEAKATMQARLAKNPATKAAYEALISLEAESGEQQDLDTYVAGKKVSFDVRPKVKEGRTLMPIRALVEALGAEVTWDAETRTVTILKGETTIELQIGSSVALVNGVEVALEVPASIEADRTLIPARFVSEGLGLYVSWLAENRTILITEQPAQ